MKARRCSRSFTISHPNAELYFATAFGGTAGFAQNIRNLQAAGCTIIVDDVGYSVESPFQDGQVGTSPTNGGIIAQAVKDVAAAGVLYFSPPPTRATRTTTRRERGKAILSTAGRRPDRCRAAARFMTSAVRPSTSFSSTRAVSLRCSGRTRWAVRRTTTTCTF